MSIAPIATPVYNRMPLSYPAIARNGKRLKSHPGDILLGDRAFCSYVDICLGKKRGIDAVIRLHQGRLQKGKKRPKYTVTPPFKKNKKTRNCPSDRLILWEKPLVLLPRKLKNNTMMPSGSVEFAN